MFKIFETEFAGRKLVIETGKMAGLANGSCLVKYGDTTVLVNATMSKEPRDGIDFLPLSVDYEERLYAAGKIPGGFLKREGRPSDKAILVSRVIDRPMRPLFPNDYRNDTAINAIAMSVDPDILPEIPAMIGAAIALAISDIPFNHVVGSVKVGLVNGRLILNPDLEQRQKSDLDLTVAGTKEKVCMIEAGANEVEDEIIMEAIKLAHSEIQKITDFIETIKKEIGKTKSSYKSFEISKELYNSIETNFNTKIYEGMQTIDKAVRDVNINKVEEELKEWYINEYSEDKYNENRKEISEIMEMLQKKNLRKMVKEEAKRVDGRKMDEIRELSCEVGILPRVHGSAIFNRGQTQVMSIVTLGMKSEEQSLDGLDEEVSKRYIHHYNFPPYSVGEARPSRGPGRREVGHGALAERALIPVLPSEQEFPYAIRVVSEVLSSNGSTSQGSVCGSTLALMDAGVPIKSPVAGISTGLFTEDGDTSNYVMVTDIQGIEDFYGDMDFKVAGTKKGITAIQVDIKVDGLTYEIIEEAFVKTNTARQYILDEIMLKCMKEPRKEVSEYAPKILTMKIDPDKIRDVIGSGGKVITKIIEETGVKIDIEDNGEVFIYGTDKEMMNKAFDIIVGLTKDVEKNEVYMGKVTKIFPFGALVEVLPGKEGMLHISKISSERVEKVEDVLSIGQDVLVKVIDIDKEQGKFSLSAKDALN